MAIIDSCNIFIFFGTLAFFVVLFDEIPGASRETLVTSTVAEDNSEGGPFSNYINSDA